MVPSGGAFEGFDLTEAFDTLEGRSSLAKLNCRIVSSGDTKKPRIKVE